MKKLILKIKSYFSSTPTVPFTWTVSDFEAAKKWAKSQPNPDNPKQSIWDKVNQSSWNESSYILAEINKHIKNLKQK